MPEPVRVTFCSFSDIKSPGTFVAPDESLLLKAACNTLVDPKFIITEWWKIPDSEKLSEPFDVGEELVAALLRVLEMVSALFDIYIYVL